MRLQDGQGGQGLVRTPVLLRDGVGAYDHRHAVPLLDVRPEVVEVGAGRVPDHHARGQMDGLGAVSDHLLRHVLDVPAGAAVTGGIPYDLQRFILRISAERSFPLPHGAQALAAAAGAIAIADDDADPHGILPGRVLQPQC